MMFLPVSGLAVLILGQDASWDLRNYHFYNPYAFLNGRMGHDIAVGHVASYYNPLMHVPFYYAVTALPPKAVGFLLGLIPACNLFPIFAITRRTIGTASTSSIAWFCLAATLLGFLGAANLSEIGTSFGDNILSLVVLAAFYLILAQWERLKSGTVGLAVAVFAGVLCGSAIGLKQPFAIYAVGMCVAFFGLDAPFWRRFYLAFLFGVGVLAGTAATGGFWLLEMWHRFGNPLFPYFNQIFQSPWAAPAPYRDDRFIPRGPWQWLFFPFLFNANPMRVGEIWFRDLRFPLLYLLLLGLLIKTLVIWKKPCLSDSEDRPDESNRYRGRFLLIFMAVAFITWMKMFAIYRYLVVLEFLAPLAIFMICSKLFSRPGRQKIAALATFALILFTVMPGAWGRRPWADDYFGIKAVMPSIPRQSLVLTTGYDPMAYMIPYFPPEVRFLRIQGFLTGPSDTPNDTDRLMQRIVAEHTGPLFILHRSYEARSATAALEAYGLTIKTGECRTMTPHVEPQQEHPFYFCAVEEKEK